MHARSAVEQQFIRMRSADVTLFLCGDVMTGRGIDQILPHAGDPRLFESYVRSAHDYVALAERGAGPIPRPVDFAYIWGDALGELARVAPDARVVNLETSVTRSEEAWPKGINYRMNPANVGCLAAAGIDVCVLANNQASGCAQILHIATGATIGFRKDNTSDCRRGRIGEGSKRLKFS